MALLASVPISVPKEGWGGRKTQTDNTLSWKRSYLFQSISSPKQLSQLPKVLRDVGVGGGAYIDGASSKPVSALHGKSAVPPIYRQARLNYSAKKRHQQMVWQVRIPLHSHWATWKKWHQGEPRAAMRTSARLCPRARGRQCAPGFRCAVTSRRGATPPCGGEGSKPVIIWSQKSDWG